MVIPAPRRGRSGSSALVSMVVVGWGRRGREGKRRRRGGEISWLLGDLIAHESASGLTDNRSSYYHTG